MTEPFSAFRDRYPDAHITSDLLLVQRDRFVVKVTVTTTSAGSASGLATHTSIEIAEDRARTRALAALGYIANDSSNGTSDLANGITDLPTESEEKEREHVEAVEPPKRPLPPSDPPAVTPDSHPISTAAASPVRPQPLAASQPATPTPTPPQPVKTTAHPAKVEKVAASVEKVAAPTDEPPTTNDIPAESTPPPAPPVDAATTQIAAEALPAPINLSDVIAQTDLELRRLGWSVETGRDYLEQTYQKRSRHELSEEELIQFLCHLESLPEG